MNQILIKKQKAKIAMKINKSILVTHPYMPPKETVMKYLDSLWKTRWLTNNGPLVQELENKLKDKLNVDDIVVFANGHLALDSAFRVYGFKEGSEVITTPYTFVSTVNAIEMNGLKPVFCDIKESDCTIDENKIEELITEKTVAICPVHVYGFPCNTEKIEEIAKRHNLKVIYDSAHAFGVRLNGKGIASFGDMSMFSMHATKVFHTVEGGAVAFSQKDLREKLKMQKNFGLKDKEDAHIAAFNAKMSDMHAAVGLANLESFESQVNKRKELVYRYIRNIEKINGGCKNSKITLFDFNRENVDYNYAYFPVLINNELGVSRDVMAERLWIEKNINARKYFSPLISDMTYYKNKYGEVNTPIAKDISKRVLTLPLYYELSLEEVDYITESIEEISSELTE